ncbi:MAG: TolC family protein [Bacteroidetes bacterium]|nr:TolC family protein [Bacteroidota bacterium]
MNKHPISPFSMRKSLLASTALIILLSCFISPLRSQENQRKFTLHDVLSLAQEQSRDAMAAKHRFRASYWEFRTFRTQYFPMLKLNTTLPSLRRSFNKITTTLGKDIFVENRVVDYSAEMSLNKIIGFTGGQIFVKSGLERLDNISDSTVSTYLSNPVTIGFSQPILAYNPYRWDNKIQPVKYEEAKRKYLEDVEQINITAINDFFDLLQAQLSIKIATINLANYDTLYKIAQGRYNLGKIAENELLQLELSFLNARADVENAQLNYQMNLSNLKSFLRLPDNLRFELLLPDGIRDLQVDVQKALGEAKTNRSDMFGFERNLLEAASEVHRARLENRFNANLYAEYGLTQNASKMEDAYKNPLEGQVVSFGIQIPILDWGLARGKIKMAESNEELVKTTIEQQKIQFEQDIYLKVMQFNMQQNQLRLAAKADTVSQKRYFVTKQRYLIGKIEITNLNIAQSETDNAQLGYISALRNCWRSYFELRKMTLYDFMQNKPLDVDFMKIAR